MDNVKNYFRVFESKIKKRKTKRTPLSGYEYFSERFEIIFSSPEYSTMFAHFNNYDKAVLDLHGRFDSKLQFEAIPGRFLKLPPHNLTFVTGSIVLIFGKFKPLDLIKYLEKNNSFLEIKDTIMPYLIIHNNKLIPINDLVEYLNIKDSVADDYQINIDNLFQILSYGVKPKENLFLFYTTLFEILLSLLKTKVLKNGDTNTIRT